MTANVCRIGVSTGFGCTTVFNKKTKVYNMPNSSVENVPPVLHQYDVSGRRLFPTQNVELLVEPFGRYEVEAVDESSVYLVDSCGGILCIGCQVRILNAYR